MNSTVRLRACPRYRAASLCIFARVEARSSAPKGSSEEQQVTLETGTWRISATRWRIPPEKLLRVVMFEAFQAEFGKHRFGSLAGFAARYTFHFERE